MILFALIVIWLLLVAFIVALCRIAAAADRRHDAAAPRYPTLSAQGPRTKLPRRIRWDGPCAPTARDLRGTGTSGASTGGARTAGVRDGRGRAGRYAAGS